MAAIGFISASLAILRVGAKVLFTDIDARTFNITRDTIEPALRPRTKAIYVMHHNGLPADMDPVMDLAQERGIAVVEDCAHSPGAHYKGRRAGAIGDIGCFSFHTVKNMTTLGEAGMITTNSDQDAYDIPRCGYAGWALPYMRHKSGIGGLSCTTSRRFAACCHTISI